MRTILKAVNKILICYFVFSMAGNVVYAREILPESVMISNGKKVISDNRGVFVIGAGTRQKIQFSPSLRRVLRESSEIAFPEATSRRLDGKDVFLIVVGVPSSSSPNGYCGAGSEDKLYAVALNGVIGKVIFSKKISSCLNNIDLSDDGVNPPLKSIKWMDNPAGISVSWARDEAGQERVHVYRKIQGGFKE